MKKQIALILAGCCWMQVSRAAYGLREYADPSDLPGFTGGNDADDADKYEPEDEYDFAQGAQSRDRVRYNGVTGIDDTTGSTVNNEPVYGRVTYGDSDENPYEKPVPFVDRSTKPGAYGTVTYGRQQNPPKVDRSKKPVAYGTVTYDGESEYETVTDEPPVYETPTSPTSYTVTDPHAYEDPIDSDYEEPVRSLPTRTESINNHTYTLPNKTSPTKSVVLDDSGNASSATDSPTSAGRNSPEQPPRRQSLLQRMFSFGTSAKDTTKPVVVKFDTKTISSYQQAADVLENEYSEYIRKSQQIVTTFNLKAAEAFEKKYEPLMQLATKFNDVMGLSELKEAIKKQDFLNEMQQLGQLRVQTVDDALSYSKGEEPWGNASAKTKIADLSPSKIVSLLVSVRQKNFVLDTIPDLKIVKKMDSRVFNAFIDVLNSDNKICKQAAQGILEGKSLVFNQDVESLIKKLITFPDGRIRTSPLPKVIINEYNKVTSMLYLEQLRLAIARKLPTRGGTKLLPQDAAQISKDFEVKIVFLEQLARTHEMISAQEEQFKVLKKQLAQQPVKAW